MCHFTPDQVRSMSLAEVHLAISGFAEMRRADAGVEAELDPPTMDEVRELMLQFPD